MSFLTRVFFVLALSSLGLAANPLGKIFTYPSSVTVLDNGLTVITIPTDSPGIISYWTVVRTGSRNEIEPGLSGFAHFFEHMMFRGTPKNPTVVYSEKLKKIGAEGNAFTDDDWTAYHITGSSAALDTFMELEADRFLNLEYDKEGFRKEAQAVDGEYAKNASSPFLILEETTAGVAFSKHTYQHTTLGFLKDIKDMPNQFDYSLKFFERWYRPDNCFVVVTGDVSPSHVVGLAKRYYGAWKPGVAKIDIPVEPAQTEERRVKINWRGVSLPRLRLAYHVPAFDPKSKEIAALDVLSQSVFSKISPLYKKLILKEQVLETLSGGYYDHRDPYLYNIDATLKKEGDFDYVQKEIYKALKQAAAEPISEQLLKDVKAHMRYEAAGSLDTAYNVNRNISMYLQLTGKVESINERYDTLEAITAQEVQDVARRIFVAENRTVVRLVGGAEKTETSALPPLAEEPVAPAKATSAKATDTEALAKAWVKAGKALKRSRRTPVANASVTKEKAEATPAAASVSPMIAVRVVFRAGSQDDPKGKEGLSNLTSRLIAEGGTKTLTYEQLLEKLYPLAVTVDVDSDKELTVFSASVHQDVAKPFFAILKELIATPRMDAQDFERIRNEQISFLTSSLRGGNDEELGKWSLQLQLYGKAHPYGHVDEGTVSALKKITLADVKYFHTNQFRAGSLQVQVEGGQNPKVAAELEGQLKAALGKGKAPLATLPEPVRPRRLEVQILEKSAIATGISMGHPLNITRKDDDYYLLAVANSAFGQHRTFNGRLMQKMRGIRGLNYGDYSYIENFIQDGSMGVWVKPNIPRRQQYFSIWIRPVPHNKAVFAVREALFELENLIEDGLTPEEFENTRSFLFHYSKLFAQTASHRLGYEIDGKFYGKKSLIAELATRLPGMKLEDVNAAIKRHLNSKDLFISMVTENGEALKKQLLSGEPSPFGDSSGLSEAILAENKQIEVYPLKINHADVIPANKMFE